MKKLHQRLTQRLSSGSALPPMLLAVLAAIAAFWLLGAFVDTLNLSIQRGEALREAQRHGGAVLVGATRP